MRSSSAPASRLYPTISATENRRDLPGLADGAPSGSCTIAQKPTGTRVIIVESYEPKRKPPEIILEGRVWVGSTGSADRRAMTGICAKLPLTTYIADRDGSTETEYRPRGSDRTLRDALDG